jgi:hypothetical protein
MLNVLCLAIILLCYLLFLSRSIAQNIIAYDKSYLLIKKQIKLLKILPFAIFINKLKYKMNRSAIIYLMILLTIVPVPLFSAYIRFVYAILTENGTCTSGNATKVVNQVININQFNEEYFKNLTSDNRQLAELVCQKMLNASTIK